LLPENPSMLSARTTTSPRRRTVAEQRAAEENMAMLRHNLPATSTNYHRGGRNNYNRPLRSEKQQQREQGQPQYQSLNGPTKLNSVIRRQMVEGLLDSNLAYNQHTFHVLEREGNGGTCGGDPGQERPYS